MSRLFGFLALFILFLTGCQKGKYEEKEREIGYKGIARVNRLLAAERFASEMGLEANSYAGAPSLPPPEGTTLVVPVKSLQSEGVLSEMGEWVLDGGNLVVYLTLDKEQSFFRQEEDEEAARAFLDYFAFELVDLSGSSDEDEDEDEDEVDGRQVTKVSLADGEGVYQTDFRVKKFLRDTEFDESEAGSMLRYTYGDGYLTVLVTGEPFRNRNLAKAEHASILWDILSVGDGDAVWFVHSTRVSFFKLLWEQASGALTLLLVTLVLLIWWAARGFGPRFVRGEDPAAQLDEHLEASGAFFMKHRAEGEVIENLRAKLFRRLARATNLPFNLPRPELAMRGREMGVLSMKESTALTERSTEKTLLGLLETLRNLDKKL